METLSNRSKSLFAFESFLQGYIIKISKLSSYHPTRAKDGLINLGVSENRLMEDLLIERFKRSDMTSWIPDYQYYFDSQGIHCLRESLATFLQERFVKNNPRVTINASCILVNNGATCCFSTLSYSIADPNDYILIESPYYSAIAFDINALTHNHVYFVNSTSERNFTTSVDDYEKAIETAKQENKRIRAILLVTPGNPIGTFVNKEKMLGLMHLAKKHELHVVVDEVYANCIYEDEEAFESVLSYFDEIPDPERTHFMWSFSKDFCSAGLRCGVIYSQNEFVIQSIAKIGLLFTPPYPIEHKLSIMLEDKDWLNIFFKTCHQRMRRSKKLMAEQLSKINITVINSNSGFFLFADFRRVLSATLSPHQLTFKREKLLFETIFNNGIYIVPGQALACTEPGWFRIIFCASDEYIVEGIERIRIGIEEFLKITEGQCL